MNMSDCYLNLTENILPYTDRHLSTLNTCRETSNIQFKQ